MPVDLKELRRLHEEYVKAKSALKPKSSAGHLTYDMAKNALVVASLDTMPELLDRLEAAEAEVARLRENGLRLVKALDRIDNHACSGEAQYGCRYCSKSGDIAREALEGR